MTWTLYAPLATKLHIFHVFNCIIIFLLEVKTGITDTSVEHVYVLLTFFIQMGSVNIPRYDTKYALALPACLPALAASPVIPLASEGRSTAVQAARALH